MLSTFGQDLRYGARMLIKTPAVTLIAIIALTLGIGANTAIFSVVHAVLIRSLPYDDGERLAIVWENRRSGKGNPQNVINLGNFFDWKEQNSVFSDMAVFFDRNVNLIGEGEPEELPGQIATPNLFSVLGVNPLMGRTFAPDEGKPGAPKVVVISYDLWERRFGRDPNIIGRKLTLNNEPNEIIGVLTPEVGWYIQKGSMISKAPEIWSPWQVSDELRQRRGRFARAVARLKPGVTMEQAQNEMNVIGARLEQEHPKFNTNWGVTVVPLRTQFSGRIRTPLLILLGAVGFVLLIACANVANLLLARAASRKKEIALRAGLGASRGRIARQLLTESLVLSAVGGALGLLLAWWGTRALLALSPPELMDLRDTTVNLSVLAFTVGLTLLTGIVFGLVPAFEASRFDLNESLKEGGKNPGGGAGSLRLRNIFVVIQVALALVLLVGAGLLMKSFSRLQSVEPGFDPNNLLTVRVTLPDGKYNTESKRVNFFKQALEKVRALPGVESAGAINTLPFDGPHSGTRMAIEGRPQLPPGQELSTGVCVTDVNYFQTMRIPLKRGRLFTEQEATEMRHVVVVNEAFARENFPGEDPLGKRVVISMKEVNVPTEIIGIVGDNRHLGLDTELEKMAYWPHPELSTSGMTLVIRARGDATSLAPATRDIIHQLDPEQPIGSVNTMHGLMARSIARTRFNAVLLGVFSVVALVMAAVGIYGVMSYSVQQRTHEIGIRMALGAQQRDVLQLVVKQGVILGIIGVAAGLLASFGLTRLMVSLLFEVTATDMRTFAGVAAGLFIVTLIACYIPARRATKVDPMVALRYE
ncbi:MAG TPA: ABC transporter permease [Pyrinomonadaceae bacterium]|nr:ABC transporter permease [Pyrinomonadaceae bacterium]